MHGSGPKEKQFIFSFAYVGIQNQPITGYNPTRQQIQQSMEKKLVLINGRDSR